jgi:acyl-CoA dehydrogenase
MSEERALLADTVSRLFGAASARAASQSERVASQSERLAFDAELWAQVEELGLPALLVPEEAGGAGGCAEDALAIARELGRFAVALPLAESLLAHEALAAAGLERPAGALTLALEVEPGAKLDAERGLFRGALANVPWGAEAAGVVAVIGSPPVPRIALLSPAHASAIARGTNLAEEPRATLRFEDARAASAPAREHAATRLFERAALLRTGQLAGALAATLARTVAHATSRVQFGKPIGQFQAVQQLAARMGSEAAAADCAAAAAFRAADCGDASFEIACAKLRANLAADFCAAGAHQIHGAIGFTREQDLRLFTQRLLAWRAELGNDRFWAERLGRRVATRGASEFWCDLTARSDAQCVTAEP